MRAAFTHLRGMLQGCATCDAHRAILLLLSMARDAPAEPPSDSTRFLYSSGWVWCLKTQFSLLVRHDDNDNTTSPPPRPSWSLHPPGVQREGAVSRVRYSMEVARAMESDSAIRKAMKGEPLTGMERYDVFVGCARVLVALKQGPPAASGPPPPRRPDPLYSTIRPIRAMLHVCGPVVDWNAATLFHLRYMSPAEKGDPFSALLSGDQRARFASLYAPKGEGRSVSRVLVAERDAIDEAIPVDRVLAEVGHFLGGQAIELWSCDLCLSRSAGPATVP